MFRRLSSVNNYVRSVNNCVRDNKVRDTDNYVRLCKQVFLLFNLVLASAFTSGFCYQRAKPDANPHFAHL